MFDANFLANVLVWGWINRIVTQIIAGVLFVLVFTIYEAYQDVYWPLFWVVVFGTLITLVIWNAFRRQRRLQEWRDTPLVVSEPQWPTQPVPRFQSGLRAIPSARWPVSR